MKRILSLMMSLVLFVALQGIIAGPSSAIIAAFSGGSVGVDYSDITFWWRVESTTFSETLDYSAGDDEASLSGGATISTDAYSQGAYGLKCPADYDYVTFASNLDLIADFADSDSEIRIGWEVYINSWQDTGRLFSAGYDPSNYIIVSLSSSDEITLTYATTGSGFKSEDSTTSPLGTGDWYYIEIVICASDETYEAYVNGTKVIDYSTTISPMAGDLTYMHFGNNSGYGSLDHYQDQIFISNDKTRDLNALKAITAYPG